MPSLNRLPRSRSGLIVLIVLLAGGWLLTHFSSGDGGSNSSNGSGAKGGTATVKVDRYVDGDTAKVFYEGDSEYVRYIGVDTPETVKEGTPVECYGEQASAFNRDAVTGRTVRLVFDEEKRDHYGRLLAYVFVDEGQGESERFLNAEILAGGYGATIEVPPNTSKADEFEQIQSAARDAGKGLWSAC